MEMKMLIIFFLVKIYQISAVQFCSDVKEPRALCRPCGDSGTKHHKCPKQCGNGRELQLCDSVCSDRCHNSECRYGDDGSLVCLQGCTKFFMGPYCQQLCMDGCVRCTQDGKRCLECEMGRYGETCQQTCDNCKDDMCRMNGTCITGCKPGYYGKQCQVGCDKCKWCDKIKSECDVCDQTKGTCFLGCSYGYYGPKCDRQCDPRCTQCHDETGKCQQCEVGWFGNDCTRKCQNCNNIRCGFEDGSCLNGCAEGFQINGTTCQRAMTEKDMAKGEVSTPVGMDDYLNSLDPDEDGSINSHYKDYIFLHVCLLLCAGIAVVLAWSVHRRLKTKERQKSLFKRECTCRDVRSMDMYATVQKHCKSPEACFVDPQSNSGTNNVEGLIYVDLDLPPCTNRDGEPIIHRKEEATHYEQIDFSRTPGPEVPDKIWEKENDDDDGIA